MEHERKVLLVMILLPVAFMDKNRELLGFGFRISLASRPKAWEITFTSFSILLYKSDYKAICNKGIHLFLTC